MKSVLGSGLVAVDHIFLVNARARSRFPRKVEYSGSAGGGSVPNALCMLSLLGYKTHIFGITGNDLAERIVKEDFKLFGVDCSHLVKKGDRNDLRFTRQFSHMIFGNGTHKFEKHCPECKSPFAREYQMSESVLDKKTEELARETDLLLLDRANKATLTLARIAKEHRRKIVYDSSFNSYGKYLERTEAILQLCNLVKINHKTFKGIMGHTENEAIIRWREKYPNTDYLLITDGENGVYGYAKIDNEKEIFRFDTIHCDRVLDSSGAGDIFLAMVASQLLLKKPPEDLSGFEQEINRGQALASLNCTLYSARALQRVYSNQKVSPSEILGSADFIRDAKKSGNSFSPRIGLPKPISKPYRLAKFNGCQICGSALKDRRRKRKIRSRKSASVVKHEHIHESLTRAPWTMSSGFEAGKTNRNMFEELASHNALLVGSGGSFTTSAFGETLYLQILGKLAKAITPYEFEGLKTLDDNTLVWLISHGGGNTDILGAALNVKRIKHSKCVVFTGNKNSKLADLAIQNHWKRIFIQSQERNFVSIIGLLSQISALCGLLSPYNEIEKLDDFFSDTSLRSRFNSSIRTMQSMAHEIAMSPDVIENAHIVGFARGWGLPPLIDLESKIVEGGICTVEISELKNFTHGRYMNLFGRSNRRVILVKTPKDVELVDYLQRRLKRYVPTFVLETEEKGVQGSVDLMVKVLFLSWFLGQIAKRNILKPRFPSQARGLYSWEPSYRRGFWKDYQRKRARKDSSKPARKLAE